ncbi:hypothetical protein B4U80_14153 [Leptotrombidium deliense]|uniref:C2H2-type domain-containing protein n=1 Tax=Leptotrombidium deliense TaxID=299467 RepID=A0A443S1L2_9ACAR|nr:hypothetical protein B4U80_14153 [Leptotrombidium deliense]
MMKNFPWTLITIRDFANHVRPLNAISDEDFISSFIDKESLFSYNTAQFNRTKEYEHESNENVELNNTNKTISKQRHENENNVSEFNSSNHSLNFRKNSLKRKTNVEKIVEKTNEENNKIPKDHEKQASGSINGTQKSPSSSKSRRNLCAKIFTTQADVLNHIRREHRKEVRFECRICYKQFPNFAGIYFHKDIHKNLRKYNCNVCVTNDQDEHDEVSISIMLNLIILRDAVTKNLNAICVTNYSHQAIMLDVI